VGCHGKNEHASTGSGACIARTNRFLLALTEAGFTVDVCSPGGSLSGSDLVKKMSSLHTYACMVAISPHPAELAVLSGTSLPLWIDMNGMHPAEINLTADKPGVPRLEMIRILSLENQLLRRGDFFSAPSRRQICSILGELYLTGRIGYESQTRIPAVPIPHCALPAEQSEPDMSLGSTFRIISTGSFNSWFDPETLFKGLEYAMSKSQTIRFSATGGLIPYAAKPYELFLDRIRNSSFSSRFDMRGWVEEEELEELQHSASAAVYTDIPGGETFLGARTRTIDWINRGIPVVCTAGAEISDDIRDHGLGIVVEQGKWKALGDAFLALEAKPLLRREIIESQSDWRNGPGSLSQVFKSLVSWCSHPVKLEENSLGRPTVSRVSSLPYRFQVLKETARKSGIRSAAVFLLHSMLKRK
jgi:glycosyltransferase involved in cell wall biosynthesis